MKEKTFDDHADEYLKTAIISDTTYKGDVQTAFVCGMMKHKELNRQQLEEVIEQLKKDYHESGDVEFALWKLQSKLQDNE